MQGVSEEDRALLLGHAIEGMPRNYATATVARLVEAANSVAHTRDRTTLPSGRQRLKSRAKVKSRKSRAERRTA